MNKSCDNCYWRDYEDMHRIYKQNKPEGDICDEYSFECDTCGSLAEYRLDEKYYCPDCVLAQFDIEEYSITHYTLDGEYLGSDEDMYEVIGNLHDIEMLD